MFPQRRRKNENPSVAWRPNANRKTASVFIFLARVSSSLVPNVCMLYNGTYFFFFFKLRRGTTHGKSKDVFETHITNTFFSLFFSFFGRTKNDTDNDRTQRWLLLYVRTTCSEGIQTFNFQIYFFFFF